MNAPIVEDHPPRPTDRMHLFLAERGSAILPEAGNADGRVTLTDAMLAVAALAPCFALARSSIAHGFGLLVVVLPALARTHVVMVRARALDSSTNTSDWLLALVSSMIRISVILGIVALIQAISVTVGGFIGTRLAQFSIMNTGGPWSSSGNSWLRHANAYGYWDLLGFLLLGTPLTLLALTSLVPRLLWVRDPVQYSSIKIEIGSR